MPPATRHSSSSGIASCDAAEAALSRVEAAVADASDSRRTGDGGKPARGKVLAARARLAEAKAQLQSLRSVTAEVPRFKQEVASAKEEC